MLINSVFGRNKCTSQARRFGRRDIKRRFLVVGLPILLVGLLAGNIIRNTFAADEATTVAGRGACSRHGGVKYWTL